MIDLARLHQAYEKVRDELLAERTPDGHWVGELSSSALSTATAVSALAVVKAATRGRGLQVASADVIETLISRGVAWLVKQQNDDGGFGDTDLSHSNIATTYLVVAALHLAGMAEQHVELLQRANGYIYSKGGLGGLRERYGIDKTFVVPIMTNLALAGLVKWSEIDPLPFELACVPQSWYRFVGMPVVSYAIPALVAIGQARFFHAPPWNPLMRLIRGMSVNSSLKVLRRMQPDSGGYLEATPLTSFVVMSLASIPKSRPSVAVYSDDNKSQTATTGRGFAEQVIHNGVMFLINSARPDGSWPIDSNLATWNTTLSINALAGAGEDVAVLLGPKCLDWLLSCQHTKRHAFTGGDPGGFGWSDLSGAVPDADDTPGAVLALRNWMCSNLIAPKSREAIEVSVQNADKWLLNIMNRDGGWPTFCRGWGKLPFDRSGSDLTAHAIRALHSDSHPDRFDWTVYLEHTQRPDGSWSPLWFGNQDHASEENPVYGTAKVLMAYRDLELMNSPDAQRGVHWLVTNQNEDGGWGSGSWCKATSRPTTSLGEPVLSAQYSLPSTSTEPSGSKTIQNPKSKIQNLKSSIEETALAVEALLAVCPEPKSRDATEGVPYSAVARGLSWLLDRVEAGQHRQPAPIGFYFAKLWYYERLYPLIFAVAALGRACRQFARPPASPDSTETASADSI